ncbi:hypothetical protein AQ490_15590 [Wenjunlia vitaminophila]|uniref:Uncharacterized protein n=1 Tax=Wenjunlia vitaminophila TaxID=76728 RepID=A0A0T6LWS0_WENVI|nr:hypothetical protein AQ490_15590 [Wenjunlia vitaminophila]
MLAVCAALLLAGCGEQPRGSGARQVAAGTDKGDPAGDRGGRGTDGAAPGEDAGRNLVPAGYGGRYRVHATVLQSPDHGPQLCDAVMESWPPQCSGPDIVGWTWDGVTSDTGSGTTWGTYRLVGTWDGTRFTLTEPARDAAGNGPGSDVPAPGAGHDGGSEPDRGRTADRPSAGAHSHAELLRIQRELHRDHPDLLSSEVRDGEVAAHVRVATEELRGELDRRYGAGTVVLHGWLTPID